MVRPNKGILNSLHFCVRDMANSGLLQLQEDIESILNLTGDDLVARYLDIRPITADCICLRTRDLSRLYLGPSVNR
jgi:hypothetical protein